MYNKQCGISMNLVYYIGIVLSGLAATAKSVDPSLDLSPEIVYKDNGTLRIRAAYTGHNIATEPDIFYIWSHDNVTWEEIKPEIGNQDSKVYYNHLVIPNAGADDAGRYTCQIKGKNLTGTTIVTRVTVDERPVTGKVGDKITMNLVIDSPSELKCFTAHMEEVPGCVREFRIAEGDFKPHFYVIAPTLSIEHYGTIEEAVINQATFNMSKILTDGASPGLSTDVKVVLVVLFVLVVIGVGIAIAYKRRRDRRRAARHSRAEYSPAPTNEIPASGVGPDGDHLNGVGPNDVQPNGVGPNDVQPNGVGPNDVQPNGV